MINGLKQTRISMDEVLVYVAVARKHLRLLVLAVCLGLLLGTVYFLSKRPVYYARSLIRYQTLERPLERIGVSSETVIPNSSDAAILSELTAPHILERTARRFGAQASGDAVVGQYLKRVQVRFNSERNLEVEVWPYDVHWAEGWAERLVEEYLRYREEKRIANRLAVIQSFSNEMAALKKKMEETVTAKFGFQSSNEMTKVGIELNQFREVPRELFIVKQRRAIIERTREILKRDSLTSIERLALLGAANRELQLNVGQVISTTSAPGAPADGGSGAANKAQVIVIPSMVTALAQPWEELEKDQRRLQLAIEDLGKNYLPGHPKMAALHKQLDAVNKSLALELEVGLNRFELEYARTLEKQQDLEKKLPVFQDVTFRYEMFQQEFELFNAGQLGWQKLHAEMSKQLDAADFGADKERAHLQFLAHLELSRTPVSPLLPKTLLLALLIGMALGAGLIFVIEYVDNSVLDLEQLEAVLPVRGLGVIPKAGAVAGLVPCDSEGNEDERYLQENFRIIRTNLALGSNGATPTQVLMVTSALAQEGKTMVSSRLAYSLAQRGDKTLLIDTDLRRGRVHRLFGLTRGPGLSQVLSGQLPLAEACRPSGLPNLSLLTGGATLHNAAEYLGSVEFANLIKTLRQQFTRIVIDSPPVLGLSETALIPRLADGVIMVVWSSHTSVRNVVAAFDALQLSEDKFTGIVLNRFDFSTAGNYYKYFYYSRDYYDRYQNVEDDVARG